MAKDSWLKTILGGSGLAPKAGKALQSRAYKLYLAEQKAMGEEPMTLEEFEKKYSKK